MSKSRRRKKLSNKKLSSQPHNRRGRSLCIEQLEDRRLLAVITVTNLNDVGAGSLRDAVAVANVTPGADQIVFSEGVQGEITLTSEIAIVDSVAITGPGIFELTVDAAQRSRIFNIQGGGIDVSLEGLFLMNGATTGDNSLLPGSTEQFETTFSGGGIRFQSDGVLTLRNAALSNSSTAGDNAAGGGIFTELGDLVMIDSILAVNTTSGDFSPGGSIANVSGSTSLTKSFVIESVTEGQENRGGGISTVSGIVSLADSVVSYNRTTGSNASGGGVATISGNISLSNSRISDNRTLGSTSGGGGISTIAGSIQSVSSTIRDNDTFGSASNGGGIFSDVGTISLRESLVSGNRVGTNSLGGGIYSYNSAAPLSILNSTISQNEASSGGGLFAFSSEVLLGSSTVAENNARLDPLADLGGGGVLIGISGGLVAENTILANNTTSSGTDGSDLQFEFSAGENLAVDFSLIGDTDGSAINGLTGVGNLLNVDPLLGPLSHYGGPTQTYALLPGSPAIDLGSPIFEPAAFVPSLTSDQRGALFQRVFNGDNTGDSRIDIGAFELQPTPFSIVVDSVRDEQDGDFSAGDLSLREAIGLANGGLGPDLITFDASLSGATIDLLRGELVVTDTLTIDASLLNEKIIIDAAQASRIIDFSGANGESTIADLELLGLTLQNGQVVGNVLSGESGGGIRFLSDGTLTLTESRLSGNSTLGSNSIGGGIFTFSGSILLMNSLLEGNTTSGYGADGGGIATVSGSVTLNSSTLSGNSTAGVGANGGGIYSKNGSVNLIDSTINQNFTTGGNGDGAAIATSSGSITIIDSTLSDNSTTANFSEGGGIFSSSGLITIVDSQLVRNSTAGEFSGGGAVRSLGGNVIVNQSAIHGNFTQGKNSPGGGIFTTAGSVMIDNSTISGNSTSADFSIGGGVASDSGSITINNSTISGNETGNFISGGGGIATDSGGIQVNNSTVTGNRTTGDSSFGGGIYSLGNTALIIRNSIVAGNTTYGGVGPDIKLAGDSSPLISPVVDFSLIGDTSNSSITASTGVGNLLNADPILASLAENGGPTPTHALLASSPAINAGDPNFTSPPDFDQRGAPFARVFEIRVDIGAFEFQPIPISADFDQDNDIDGADFLAWQRGFGTPAPNATKADGDANNDTTVDASDLTVWQDQFGQTVSPIVAASTAPPLAPVQTSIEPVGPVEVADVVELAAVSGQSLAVSSPFSAVTAQSAVKTPSIQAPTIGRRAELIDAAIAVGLIRNGQDVETPLLDEESVFAKTYADRVFFSETIAPASAFVDAYERPGANSSDVDAVEDAWLTEELLERVFG